MNMAAQILIVFEIRRFLGFFLKNLDIKIFTSFHLYSEALSEYSQELRTLPLNLTAEICVLFEI